MKQTICIDSLTLPLLTEDPASWSGSSLLSVAQITPPGLKLLLSKSQSMRTLVRERGGGGHENDDATCCLPQKTIVATVFFEASTRTACSFQAAAVRLGAHSMHVDGQGNTSAAKKGETLEDTIKCLECYSDLIVLRHPVTGSVGKAIAISRKPVLNAGDGVGEHPTQALLDVFTIYDELKLDGAAAKSLTVVLLGDLKHGRTVHSLAKLLCTTRGILWNEHLTLRFCAPPGLQMPDYIQDSCAAFANAGVELQSFADPLDAVKDANVLYVTRVQRERFESDAEYDLVKVS